MTGAAKVKAKLSGFWLGPLLTGFFVSMGYGVTERLIILHRNSQKPIPEAANLSKPLTRLQLKEIRKKLNRYNAFELEKNLTLKSMRPNKFNKTTTYIS